MSIFGGPSADVVISQQTWVNITAEAEKLAAMAKECAAERQALRDKNDALRARVAKQAALLADLRDAIDSGDRFSYVSGPLRALLDAAIGDAGNKSLQRIEGE